ncbi:acyltransferase [Gordonia insulae]|uniref:Acyltransferase 3 domain-containing protein n=1 Tax=Gordonia insulae TaxID=2420509 RepID=A0A3G8JH59_9ACTN|nr:acyltransferase [Gordonia insulae]AZG43862.1 hypothetical protein D7316_00433 [Gordonia insulae]
MRTHLDMRAQNAARRSALPTPAELDAISGGRDRVVDLIRLSSLVVVIAGHSLMLTVVIDSDGIRLGNLLADVPVMQAATWLLQILPLFFLAGAAAATYGLRSRPTPSTGHWLLGRARRLLRPVFWYLLFVTMLLAALGMLGMPTVADAIARLGVQLLWFLGAYLLVLAIVPLLQRISTTAHVVVAIGLGWGATAAVDVARLTFGWEQAGYLSFVTVWSLPAVLGVAYAKRLLTTAQAALLVIVFLVVDVALVFFGPYEVSLVTVPGQRLSNMSPPSLLLAGHAIVLCALAIAAVRRLRAVVARPRIWWWVAVGNRGAMTLYLWHLPVLAVIIAAGELLGLTRDDPGSAMFPLIIGLQTALLLAAMVPVVAVLSGLEHSPLPWWDDPVAPTAGRSRDVTVLLAVLIVGISTLMLARTGLVDAGPVWLVAAVGGAALARAVSARTGQPAPRRHDPVV